MSEFLDTRQVQDELLSMMAVLDDVLQEHAIPYTLDGGTLLGAVRHRGFIPWDDDIDVMIPRPSFDRLCAHREWAPAGYAINPPGSEGCPFPYAKFCNLGWRAQEPMYEGVLDERLWIDIFPADCVPDDGAAEAALMKNNSRLAHGAAAALVNIDQAASTAGSKAKGALKKLLFPIYRKTVSPAENYQAIARNVTDMPYGSTSRVGDMVWYPYKEDKPGFPVGDFDNLIELDFAGRKFKACPHWDEYLTGLYGDYMVLPPVDQRVTHGMRVWRASEYEGEVI